MKVKILAFFAFFISGFAAQSQVLKGGINFANISITNDGDIDDANSLTSFQVGISGDIKILPVLFFQPGILFTGKGSKTQSGDPSSLNYSKATSNPMYIEIPANFVFKTPTGTIKFFAGGGPYLAVGVSGKIKNEGKIAGLSYSNERNIEFSSDDPSTLNYEEGAGYGILKRFDYGLNATAGIQATKIVLAVNYGFGLAKLQSGTNSSADDKNKHRVLSFTVGIKL